MDETDKDVPPLQIKPLTMSDDTNTLQKQEFRNAVERA